MKTVLLVDDNRDVLEVTAFMLEDAGYEVVAASSSEQALEVASARQDDIGVVLTDLNLKQGMSGIEMGVAMHEEGLTCPMIVMSGDLEPPETAMQSWMIYLSKPFDRKTLLKAITDYA